MGIYEQITDKILQQLEAGVIPWRKPWRVQPPMNIVTRKHYRGINVLLLSFNDYSSNYWLTYRQAKDLKGYVKAGAKGTQVVYWNFAKVKAKDTEDETEKLIPFMKTYTVFNAEQCSNITIPKDDRLEFNPIEQCEKVIGGMPNQPKIYHNGNQACYYPSKDTVSMPKKEAFHTVGEYYSTLFHELTHSTGHASRLNRKGITELSSFGSETYSKEELVAEIGASFLCGMTGIVNQTIQNASSYIHSWLKTLKNDKRLIIVAASQAQKSTDYILNKTYKEE